MPEQPSPARLEAFSDGVIAVIITIMVLDLKVPAADGLASFVGILPTLAVYTLSFFFTGIYWVNHHHLADRLKHVDHAILWANLFFLFCLSLLPFFTNYLVDKRITAFPVALYSAALFLIAMSFLLLGRVLIRHMLANADVYQPSEADGQVSETYKGFASLATYFFGIPIAYWHPWFALTLVALVTLIWIVPTFAVKPRHCAPEQHPTA
jgi:uncharacterized membrane protein